MSGATRILDRIDTPAALRTLSYAELTRLAAEIREEIVATVARNGGHLAPSLGVVELTLALHLALDSPRDKIIWDVGHQSYAHKLITGRRGEFHTLRLPGGLSGFPKREESEHDAYNTGHSSTSISAALGMALARDLAGDTYAVAAVIGDGSLTGGMAFEALNHAGHVGCDLLVILNDNEMSIARNVGALSSYLARLRVDPRLRRVEGRVQNLVRRVPWVGSQILDTVDRLKGSVKYLVVPGMLFEEMGFTYLGPIDGHDIRSMRRTIEDARKRKGPFLIHVLTQKGRGYAPAMADPRRFHGVGPFDPATGAARGAASPGSAGVSEAGLGAVPSPDGRASPSFTDCFREYVVDMFRTDPRLVAITAAMPDGTGLDGLMSREEFKARVFDVGIAEQHAVTLAAGMAVGGLRPIVAVYSTFLQRAYDQIVHDVCLQSLPVVFAIDRAGIAGEDGPTHQGSFDLSYLCHIPNLVVMAPSDGDELYDMLHTAVEIGAPCAVRYPKGPAYTHPVHPAPAGASATGPCPGDSHPAGYRPVAGLLPPRPPRSIPRGRARVVHDPYPDGRGPVDVAVVAVGSMVGPALSAGRSLAVSGITALVLDARFAKPLDSVAILAAAGRARAGVITVEENALAGGFGQRVASLLAEQAPAATRARPLRVHCLGIPDRFVEHGPRSQLLLSLGLSREGIEAAARALVEESESRRGGVRVSAGRASPTRGRAGAGIVVTTGGRS